MKLLLILLIFFCAFLSVSAQEKISPDSILISPARPENLGLHIEMPPIFDTSSGVENLNLFDESIFQQPLLPDYNKLLDLKKYWNTTGLKSESFSNFGSVFAPFIQGKVFNQASYQVNDRLTFGGNSFGAQSIFETPQINSSIQEMSIKGASMFMQYKVSNNFKVETRVSISNGRSRWEP